MTAAQLVQPVMGLDEVEERIARIGSAVRGVWGDLVALYEGRAWVTLGLPSWDALCDERLGMRPKLPAAERREVVAELTVAGMSTRAIASTLDVNRETVMKDQSQLVGNQPVEVRGLDGRTRTYDRNPITPEMRQAADDVMRGPTPEELAAAAEREAERAARRRAEADAENARQRNTEWHLAMATIRGTQHPVQLAILKSAYEPSTYHYDSAELHRMADILHDIANRWDEA